MPDQQGRDKGSVPREGPSPTTEPALRSHTLASKPDARTVLEILIPAPYK